MNSFGTVNIEGIIEMIKALENDHAIPKNVKSKLASVLTVLKGDEELKVKVNIVLNDLDSVVDDPNLQAYTRTQLWNIVSVLESVKE